MNFENSFEVSLPPDEAWRVLLDVERVAPCMPGAELTEIVDERTFRGNVSVRLGPVALSFSGEAVIENVDDTARKARVRAQGRDPKGRGGAAAVIDFQLNDAPNGSLVVVRTDLTLSGSVAQYGRGAGMIKSVAGQLIGQFSDNLEHQLTEQRTTDSTTHGDGEPGSHIRPGEPRPISAFSLFWRALLDRLRGFRSR